MATTNDIEVIIGGKVITVSGNESQEYLQKVASYINNKMLELMKSDAYKKTKPDMHSVLLALNIADDLFELKNQMTNLEDQLDNKDKDLENIKHKLVASQIKLESLEKNLKAAESKNTELNNKLVRLESELKNRSSK